MLSAQSRQTLGDGSHPVLHFYVSAMGGPRYEFLLEANGRASFQHEGKCFQVQIDDVDAFLKEQIDERVIDDFVTFQAEKDWFDIPSPVTCGAAANIGYEWKVSFPFVENSFGLSSRKLGTLQMVICQKNCFRLCLC
jgi:hypothetical protein